MEILGSIIFFVVVCALLFAIAQGITEWAGNNSKPILSVPARVVAKRSKTSGSTFQDNTRSVSTYYYATFELETGERMEFGLSDTAYGMLVEGDEGTLTYQGTRYYEFVRNRQFN